MTRTHYTVECAFCTDEDYALDKVFVRENAKYAVPQDVMLAEIAVKEAAYEEDGYEPLPDYKYVIKTDDISEARLFLERLSVAFRVSYTHRTILGELYEMTDRAINFLDKSRPREFYEELNGNYAGSYISITRNN